MPNLFKKLVLNTVSETFVSLLGNALSLLTLPFYIGLYGDEKWGVYLYALGLSGALLAFNFGTRTGLRRYVARYTSNGYKRDYEIALSLTTIIMITLGLINSIVIIVLSFDTKALLKLTETADSTAQLIFFFAAIYAIIFWLMKVTEGILEGYQDYTAKSRNNFIGIFFNLVVFVFAYFYQPNFERLCFLLFIAHSTPFLMHVLTIMWKGYVKGIKLKFKLLKSDFRSDFFKFSTDVFVLGMLNMLVFKADKFIIGSIAGASYITIYVVITKPMFIIKTIESVLFKAVEPLIAQKDAANESGFIEKLIFKGYTINFIIVLPIVCCTILLLPAFISLWVGAEYNRYVFWGQIAAGVFLFKPLYTVTVKTLINLGVTKELKRIRLQTSFINLLISILLTFKFAIGGVIMGTIADNIWRLPQYLRLAKRRFGITTSHILNSSVLILIVYSSVVSICLYFVISYINVTDWITFIALSLVTGILLFSYSVYYLIAKEKLFYRF